VPFIFNKSKFKSMTPLNANYEGICLLSLSFFFNNGVNV
jgi:hypothetical protein